MRLLPELRPGPRWGGLQRPANPQLGKILHPEKSVTYFFFPQWYAWQLQLGLLTVTIRMKLAYMYVYANRSVAQLDNHRDTLFTHR